MPSSTRASAIQQRNAIRNALTAYEPGGTIQNRPLGGNSAPLHQQRPTTQKLKPENSKSFNTAKSTEKRVTFAKPMTPESTKQEKQRIQIKPGATVKGPSRLSRREKLASMFAAMDSFIMLSRSRNQFRVPISRLISAVENTTGRQCNWELLEAIVLIYPDSFRLSQTDSTVFVELGSAGRQTSSQTEGDELPRSVIQARRLTMRENTFRERVQSVDIKSILKQAKLLVDSKRSKQQNGIPKDKPTQNEYKSKKRALLVSSTSDSDAPGTTSKRRLCGLSASILEKISERNQLVKALEPKAREKRAKLAMLQKLPSMFNCITLFLTNKRRSATPLDILQRHLVKQNYDRSSKQSKLANEMLEEIQRLLPEWCTIEPSSHNSKMVMFKTLKDSTEAATWRNVLIQRIKASTS